MGTRILKALMGLALVPFCAGFTWQLGTTLVSVTYRPDLPYYFIAGGIAYLAMHVLFRKPILTYVVGHELTHALFAVLFGGSVKSFQAGERGGRVTITKSNFIITLAPYFFPLYTFVAIVLHRLAVVFHIQGALGWLVFLAGATFGFHVILTLQFLRIDQNDIKEQGAIFSYPLIYLFNVVFCALLIYILLAENMSYLIFLAGGIMKSMDMIYSAFHALFDMIWSRL